MVIRSSGTFPAMGIYSPLEPACSLVTQPRILGHCDLFRAPEVRVLLPWVRFLQKQTLKYFPTVERRNSKVFSQATVGTWSSTPVGISGGRCELTLGWRGPGVGRLGLHPPMSHPEEVRAASRRVDAPVLQVAQFTG